MKLGDFISRIEEQTGTSITDPVLLDRELMTADGQGEYPARHIECDGDVILLVSDGND